MLLERKTAIITGCNRGIGKATMETFAENGAEIFACVRKESDEFSEIQARLAEKTGVTITPIYFDFAENEQVKIGIKTIISSKKLLKNKNWGGKREKKIHQYHEEWARKNGYRDNDFLHATNTERFKNER